MNSRLKTQIEEGSRFPPQFVSSPEDMFNLTWKLREYVLVEVHLEGFFEIYPQHRTSDIKTMAQLRTQMREHLRNKGIL